MHEITSHLHTPQDVIDWLNRLADGLERIEPPRALPRVPWPGIGEARLLEGAAIVLRHALANDLMMHVPVLESALQSDPIDLGDFASTVYELATVWAGAMKVEKPPPVELTARAAWSLRIVAQRLWRDQGRRFREIVAEQATGKGIRRKTRRRVSPRTISDKQIEALKVVGECENNFAEAARRLGKDPKTVRQLYHAGLRNAGKLASKLIGKTGSGQAIPQDRRGQAAIAANDDGPAAIGPRPRVHRDRR